MIGFRNIPNPLRLFQVPDCIRPLARFQIDDFQRIVTERGNKKSFAFDINGQMIDSTLYVGYFDGSL